MVFSEVFGIPWSGKSSVGFHIRWSFFRMVIMGQPNARNGVEAGEQLARSTAREALSIAPEHPFSHFHNTISVLARTLKLRGRARLLIIAALP